MFKTIEYKLLIWLGVLIVSVAGATYLFIAGETWYGALTLLVMAYAIKQLRDHYRKFNTNILFLLNALENGDYTFHFSETKISRTERELNAMLNRIKGILTKARKEVMENEEFLSLIVESVSTGIVIVEENNSVRRANRAAMQMLGLNVFTHLAQLSTIDPAFPALFAGLSPDNNAQIKIANEREDMLINLNLSKIMLRQREVRIITLSNIGNELETKEMESWIKLIRVMTHEIMNSIAPITSLSDTMLTSYAADRNTVEAFETINSTAKGLLTFVESYRRFTGIPKPTLRDESVASLLAKVLKLESHALAEKNITVELIPPTPEFTIRADESQIMQVLVNIIKNAVEAADPRESGRIIIRAGETNGKVQIDICNNGRPIPADVAPHIFIPFFTTKDSGTGIGLSVSRYVMRLHGGNLKHHTSDGWTVFSMVF